ncbi:hypothetical protein V6N13_147092 [Hibiscus sabdariffa]
MSTYRLYRLERVARWGRAVYINIQQFVQFQLKVNIVALMLNLILYASSDGCSATMGKRDLGELALAIEAPPNVRTPCWKECNLHHQGHVLGQIIYQLVVLAILKFDKKWL